MNSDKLLILVIVFFFLGCRVSCGNMNENFAWTGGACNCLNYKKCKETSSCSTSDAQAICTNSQIRSFRRKLKTPQKCASTAGLNTYANVRGKARQYNANNFRAYRPNFPTTVTAPVQRVQTQCPACPVCPACNSCCPTQQAQRRVFAANTGSYQVNRNAGNAFGQNVQGVDCSMSLAGIAAGCANPTCCAQPQCKRLLPNKCTR